VERAVRAGDPNANMNRRSEDESPALARRRPPWKLARKVAVGLHRVGLGRAVRRGRSLVDHVLPVSVYRVGTIELAARTVGQREYAQEMQMGRDSYLLELIRESLGPGDEAADVGAYIGAVTITAARAVGANGHIHAFEPDPQTFSILRQTVHANGVTEWVTLRRLALAGTPGQATLYRWNRDESQNSLIRNPAGGGRIDIETAAFDEVLRDRNVTLVKIDVEGAELEVLAGMSRWLAASPVGAILIVENNPTALAAAGASVDQLLARLKANGFTPFLIDEHRRTLAPVRLQTLRTRDVNVYWKKTDRGSRRISSRPTGAAAAPGRPTATPHRSTDD
jgi:FkbM family methyltransferase